MRKEESSQLIRVSAEKKRAELKSWREIFQIFMHFRCASRISLNKTSTWFLFRFLLAFRFALCRVSLLPGWLVVECLSDRLEMKCSFLIFNLSELIDAVRFGWFDGEILLSIHDNPNWKHFLTLRNEGAGWENKLLMACRLLALCSIKNVNVQTLCDPLDQATIQRQLKPDIRSDAKRWTKKKRQRLQQMKIKQKFRN